jgi:large subunit ribosomal protein L30
MMPGQLEITYTRSAVGRSERQRRTVEALGLRRLHQTVRHQDNPTIRGMVNSVKHLLTWREIEEDTE